MRSRYTAHATDARDYLESTHASPTDPAPSGAGAGSTTTWTGLEIVDTEAGGARDKYGLVEFRAHYRTRAGETGVHHERSRFRRIEGHWAYVDGEMVAPAPLRTDPKPGRNTPCPCGSGRKYKRCCGA